MLTTYNRRLCNSLLHSYLLGVGAFLSGLPISGVEKFQSNGASVVGARL